MSSSLSGKTFLVTGANSGLGLETTKALAARGATVIMGCRSLDRARYAVKEIVSGCMKADEARLIALQLDLSSLSSVRRFCLSALAATAAIDVLILNAGVMYAPEGERTKDGLTIQEGVNYVAHVLMVKLLLGRIKEAGRSARIVILSSILLKTGDIKLKGKSDAITSNHTISDAGYSDSKAQLAVYASQLRQRLASDDIRVFCVSPGWCKTNLGRDAGLSWAKWFGAVLIGMIFLKSARKGSETIFHCATSEQAAEESRSGSYFYRNGKICSEMETLIQSRFSEVEQEELWTETELLLSEEIEGELSSGEEEEEEEEEL